MGTNYFYHDKPPCTECKRPFESLHIGKSSFGWCFALHVIPELGLNSLIDWQNKLSQGGVIRDEYGNEIDHERLVEIITCRAHSNVDDIKDPEWLRRNVAEAGPNGLARSKIDQTHCIGHGPGTWDLIIGDFR